MHCESLQSEADSSRLRLWLNLKLRLWRKLKLWLGLGFGVQTKPLVVPYMHRTLRTARASLR